MPASASKAKPVAKRVKKPTAPAKAKTPEVPEIPDKSDEERGKLIVVRMVVGNILSNAKYVLDACKCKTLMPAHLKAVSMIQATIKKNNMGSMRKVQAKQTGGDPVQASEYYGVNSGRYFDISEVSKLETQMFADSSLSRAELPLKIGGGKNDFVGIVAKECSRHKMRVSSEAKELIAESARLNYEAVLQKSKSSKYADISKAIGTSSDLVHLRV